MSSQEKQSVKFLKWCPGLGSVILCILLIVFMSAIAHDFECPCRNDLNAALTGSIFLVPTFFIFVVMFHLLRPLRYGWIHCPERVEDDTQRSCAKTFIFCLIPPAMWIFILLLNGSYVACVKTDWEGVPVTDTALNIQWCKPTDGTRNEIELQILTLKYINLSKNLGFGFIFAFSALSLVIVAIYDSCISGKCDHCPSRLLLFCGRKVRRGGEHRQDDVECGSPTSSISTHPLMAFSKNE